MKSTEQISEYINTAYPNASTTVDCGDMGTPWITCTTEHIKHIAKFLRDDEQLRFDTLMCLSGVHYPEDETLGVVYHLHSTSIRHSLAVKIKVPIENPQVDSVESIWKTADWHEREAYDMYGLEFTGHPNLKRILCPDEWIGFPLRKDYVPQESYMGITTLNN